MPEMALQTSIAPFVVRIGICELLSSPVVVYQTSSPDLISPKSFSYFTPPPTPLDSRKTGPGTPITLN